MSDDSFDRLIGRIDELHAEMATQHVVIKHRLDVIDQHISDLAMVLIGHLADHRRDTP